MRKFRTLNKWYAWFMGYFWLECPLCHEMFGGHEISDPLVIEFITNRVACWKHLPFKTESVQVGNFERRSGILRRHG